jgi:hypothetical protein
VQREKSLAKRDGYISVVVSNVQVDDGKDYITIRLSRIINPVDLVQ